MHVFCVTLITRALTPYRTVGEKVHQLKGSVLSAFDCVGERTTFTTSIIIRAYTMIIYISTFLQSLID